LSLLLHVGIIGNRVAVLTSFGLIAFNCLVVK